MAEKILVVVSPWGVRDSGSRSPLFQHDAGVPFGLLREMGTGADLYGFLLAVPDADDRRKRVWTVECYRRPGEQCFFRRASLFVGFDEEDRWLRQSCREMPDCVVLVPDGLLSEVHRACEREAIDLLVSRSSWSLSTSPESHEPGDAALTASILSGISGVGSP